MNTRNTLVTSYPCSSIPRPFCESFKQEAIRQLKLGNCLKNVTKFMGVSKTTMKRWILESSGMNLVTVKPNNQRQRITTAVKPKIMVQCDLQKVEPSSQLTPNLVSKNINDWSVHSNTMNVKLLGRKSIRFDDEFRKRALTKLSSGLSVRKVARIFGVSANTLHKWQADSLSNQNNIDKLLYGSADTVNTQINVSDIVNKQSMRKHYNDQFKLEAVELIESGKSVRRVAKQLNVSELTLHRWRNQVNPDKQSRSYSSANGNKAVEQEVQLLRKQLNRIEYERDLLRKSLSIVIELTQ